MSSTHIYWIFHLLMLIIIFCDLEMHAESSKKLLHSTCGDNCQLTRVNMTTQQAHSSHRKLLVHGNCTNRDISISQSKDSTSGIPQFIVQIINTCVSGCPPSDIHLHCGWFASARIVNPTTFKRVSYDDCLVNGGKALMTSQAIRFTYSNSFMYPLAFKSAKFCSALP
ncbi:protein TAPETUM DETERMINANT 1-like [Durio zibethinus]|uniref:Protein TAPETUM DETERMINANT 1-like n=1 Tax=Durio zibethinus TaxID=66656 RepID=A0A6P6A808_DURZI|nr:protein TAPETUM DETERMINANT 1-like [Durio zibethinus]